MSTQIASSNLATISYRIATEPHFVEKLNSLIEAHTLESGETISEEDAAVLQNYINHGQSLGQTVSEWVELPGPITNDTWMI